MMSQDISILSLTRVHTARTSAAYVYIIIVHIYVAATIVVWHIYNVQSIDL